MGKKELLASAPWRGEETSNKFEDAKLRATNHPGTTPTMHVPRKKSVSSRADDDDDDDPEAEIDPELRYSFQRNFQFFDPEGIAGAQKSLGLGQEEKARRVR